MKMITYFRINIKLAILALVVSLSGLGGSSLFAQSLVEHMLAASEAKISQLEGEWAIQKAVLGRPSASLVAISGMSRRSPALRFYSDPMGFSTGTRQFLKEFTLTPEFTISENLVTRFEWRANRSGDPF